MANPSKRRGTDFEVKVLKYLRDMGVTAFREPNHGRLDVGDITTAEWTLELKAQRRIELAEFADEALTEAIRAGNLKHAVVIKRSRKPIKDAYCVMPLWLLTALIQADTQRECGT